MMTPAQKWLRQIMSERNLTQAELAKLTGYAISTVESWLAAENASWRRNINARTMRVIATSLGVDEPSIK